MKDGLGPRFMEEEISFIEPNVLIPRLGELDMMTATLVAEDTLDVQQKLANRFSDTGESFTIEIRKGIAQLHKVALDDADISIDTTREVLNQILAAGLNTTEVIGENMMNGEFTFTNGGVKEFGQFIEYFATAMYPEEIMLIVR